VPATQCPSLPDQQGVAPPAPPPPSCCQGNERLLKLYESGLPAWAIYAPQYGLFYRPWLRSLTWALFYAFSAFSFAMGFYDLLKVVPGLQVKSA
jgi:hypothetical protein